MSYGLRTAQNEYFSFQVEGGADVAAIQGRLLKQAGQWIRDNRDDIVLVHGIALNTNFDGLRVCDVSVIVTYEAP